MKYAAHYSQSDFGTERLLTVSDGERIIGQCDPFPHGIPVNAKCRARLLREAAMRAIQGFEDMDQAVQYETAL